MKKLKIFSDPLYLPQDTLPVDILKPFWKLQSVNDLAPWSKAIESYTTISSSLFEITSLEEADIAILPFDWIYVRGNAWLSNKWSPKLRQLSLQAMHTAMEFAAIVKKANKPLIIFFTNDASHEEIPIKNAFIFRQSLIASRRTSYDFALNAVYEDLLKCYLNNTLTIRKKQEKPVVGFTGFATKASWNAKLKAMIYQGAMLASGGFFYSPYKGHDIRTEALKILSESQDIEDNFIIRDSMAFFNQDIKIENKLKLRIEYVNNIINSDYILCCRGRGNFSFRLYEALCCGRIPIFIDTDCVLPFDFKINWKNYCVWIDSEDLQQLPQKVMEFHNNLSPQEFINLQYECRNLWQEMLSQEGFFSNFWRHLSIKEIEKPLSTIQVY